MPLVRDTAALANLKELVKGQKQHIEQTMKLISLVKDTSRYQYDSFFKHVTFVAGGIVAFVPARAGRHRSGGR